MSKEKHVPDVKVCGDVVRVNVDSVNHPVEGVHGIEWIRLITDKGSYRKRLNPGTLRSEVHDDFKCPLCFAGKDQFPEA